MKNVRRVKRGPSYCYVDPDRVIAVVPTFRTNGFGQPEQSGVSIVCEHQANIGLEGVTPEDVMCDLGYSLSLRAYERIDSGEFDADLDAHIAALMPTPTPQDAFPEGDDALGVVDGAQRPD